MTKQMHNYNQYQCAVSTLGMLKKGKIIRFSVVICNCISQVMNSSALLGEKFIKKKLFLFPNFVPPFEDSTTHIAITILHDVCMLDIRL